MKTILLKLKRRVVLFKEVAQMALNRTKPEELEPWLSLLSSEMKIDYFTHWKIANLPDNEKTVLIIMRKDVKREVMRICNALLVLRKENSPEVINDEIAFAFAELCSELGHLAVGLKSPDVDEKLTDVACSWITFFVPPRKIMMISHHAASILFASVMQFKGMGLVELKRDNPNFDNIVN